MSVRGKIFKENKPKKHIHRSEILISMDKLRVNERAVIKTVGGAGALRRSLLDMGLTPNTEIMVRKVAPMGDPLEIYLRGYELTLRRMDAKEIIVEVAKDECSNCDTCSSHR